MKIPSLILILVTRVISRATRIKMAAAICAGAVLPLRAEVVPLAARDLPDALVLSSGKKVTTAAQWEAQRRPELLELFRANVYGRAPVGRPESLVFRVENTDPQAMDGAATLKQVAIELAGPGGAGRIRLVLFVPNRRTGPAPAFLLICNRPASNIDPTRATKSEFWPAEDIIARGYAAAAFQVDDVDPDDKDVTFKNGVHAIFDPPQRAADAWATIAAWAWGASRCLDYLASDADIDAARVAVVGHSRGGKTALWAGAEDRRFAMVVSNDSGCTGAALARGKAGERIADINRNFPHWFCRNYRAFDGRESALPVDQHELIALLAPRPAYIASASLDAHADPQSELLAGVAASPAYQLFGKEGLPATALPAPNTALHTGWIGHHLREGKHDLTLHDWQRFMDFADQRGLKPAGNAARIAP